MGKYAYERGRYQDAVLALELALNKEGPFSQLGGDIQMWLALAYQVSAGPKSGFEARGHLQVFRLYGPFSQLGGNIQLWLALAYRVRCSRPRPSLLTGAPVRSQVASGQNHTSGTLG